MLVTILRFMSAAALPGPGTTQSRTLNMAACAHLLAGTRHFVGLVRTVGVWYSTGGPHLMQQLTVATDCKAGTACGLDGM